MLQLSSALSRAMCIRPGYALAIARDMIIAMVPKTRAMTECAVVDPLCEFIEKEYY